MLSYIAACYSGLILVSMPYCVYSQSSCKECKECLSPMCKISCSLCWSSPTREQEEVIKTACERTELRLNCERESTLDIKSVLYGRLNTETCKKGDLSPFRPPCRAEDALNKVRKVCQHQRSCGVAALNDVFEDPCPGVFKYLQVSYTCENIGWYMVFKGVSGAGNPDLYHLWRDNGSLNALNDSARALTDSLRAHYKSPIVDRWSELEIQEVKIAFYNDDVEKANMIFDGNGTGKMDWFSFDKITSSSYDDLTSQKPNYFSIKGHSDDRHSRHWFSNRNYGGCGSDHGWTVVLTDKGPCGWESKKNDYDPQIMYSPTTDCVQWESDKAALADFFAVFLEYTDCERCIDWYCSGTCEDAASISETPHVTEFTEITTSVFTGTHGGKTTSPTIADITERENKGEYLVEAAVGSVVFVFILICIAIMILCFMKKKKNGSKSHSVSRHEITNSIYMTNANETHSMEISGNNPGHIDTRSDSEYNALHDTTTEKHENEYASYPGDRQEQITSTISAVASNGSPYYSTMQNEEKNDVVLKQKGSTYMFLHHDASTRGNTDSEYMCLQQDGGIQSTTIVPPYAVHAKADKDSDIESEYSYATYQGKGQNQEKPMENTDRSKGYTPNEDSAVNNTLNVRSPQNDDAYDELKVRLNDSNEVSYDTLNHLTGTRVPDDLTDDYNKLIPTPEYDEESDEYSHFNREFLNTDESAADANYGKFKR